MYYFNVKIIKICKNSVLIKKTVKIIVKGFTRFNQQ